MSWSPSTSSPVGVDGHDPVGVAVEGQAARRRPRATTAACRDLGVVRPAAVVDVGAVGIGVEHRHRGAQARPGPGGRRRRRRRGRSRPPPAGPGAGARPGPPPPRGGGRSGPRRRGRCAAAPTSGPRRALVRAGDALGLDGRRGRASTSAWRRRRACRPPVWNSLMPLSPKGLCEAEIMAPGSWSAAQRWATPGVGSTPRSTESAPSEARPGGEGGVQQRAGDPGVATDRARGRRPRTWAAARPRARASSGVSSVLAGPRTPSVPNASHGVPRRRAPSPRDDRTATGLEAPAGSGCAGWEPRSALRVLRSLAGLLEAVLLGLLLAGVAGEEPGRLERRPRLGVELDEAHGRCRGAWRRPGRWGRRRPWWRRCRSARRPRPPAAAR